jgi:hypothetical protein
VNRATGEVRVVYSSDLELDGTTWVPCGNRRAAVCEPCSRRYKGDAYQVIVTGLAGGKGIPASVAQHPSCFTTLTAPSFGPVHGLRGKGPCRARRDKPLCEQGRPLWCTKRHRDGDEILGTPLCWECYDYRGHVVWNYYAPELWRRTSIALQRDLAKRCGLSVKAFTKVAKISYSKAAEFQARGLVHLHVPIRLDDPAGADGNPPCLPITSEQLEDAIRAAAAQVDTRTITPTAERDRRQTTVVHPE